MTSEVKISRPSRNWQLVVQRFSNAVVTYKSSKKETKPKRWKHVFFKIEMKQQIILISQILFFYLSCKHLIRMFLLYWWIEHISIKIPCTKKLTSNIVIEFRLENFHCSESILNFNSGLVLCVGIFVTVPFRSVWILVWHSFLSSHFQNLFSPSADTLSNW